MSEEIDRLVALLSDFGQAVAPRAFPTDDAAADDAGLYAWWADSTATELLSQLPGDVQPPYLIYVGQAGATMWPSGKKSTATLKSRILSNHIGGNASSSTFRLTLSAILAGPLNLGVAKPGRLLPEDNRRVSTWIKENLRVVITPWPERDTLKATERKVLKRIDPPLNIDGQPATPFREHLTKLRCAISSVQL